MPERNSVTVPPGVIRATRRRLLSMNHRMPSDPVAIPAGTLSRAIPAENSLTTPVGLIRPTRLPCASVNQRWPSGSAVIPDGLLRGLMP